MASRTAEPSAATRQSVNVIPSKSGGASPRRASAPHPSPPARSKSMGLTSGRGGRAGKRGPGIGKNIVFGIPKRDGCVHIGACAMNSRNFSARMAGAKSVPPPAPHPPSKTAPLTRKNRLTLRGSNKAKKDRGASSWGVFFELLGRFKLEYACLALVSSLLSATEGILHPLLIKSIFDEIAAKRGFNRFVVLVISYLALGLFINFGSTVAALWSKSLENRLVKSMSRRLLESYYEKEYASVLHNGYGYFINRVYGDLREGLVPLLALVQTTIKQGVLLISLLLVLLYLSWQAFLFLVAIIPISSAVGALLGRRIKALTSQERDQEGGVLTFLNKALGAFRMVKVFDLFSRTAPAFDNRLGEYLSTSYRRYKVTRVFQTLNDLTMVISDFLSMFVGALFVLRGALTFGGYLAFVNTFWRAVTTLMQLFNRMADFHAFGTITGRIASFLATPAGGYYLKGRSPSINNIGFSYNGKPILKDFSLQLAPGERVVIVGPNGSGKTTLANILSGYLAPSHGDMVLPERISSVTLPISFPPLKVKDLVSDTDLLSAFRLQHQEVLEAFADELSAGQQQKLAISLALAQEADLYVIDEPLANLDPESRDTAINLILERTKEKTLILVMHGSEEYHKLFDRVIRMDLLPVDGDGHHENS
jgi:ATP-binding cassette subfamily B protein